MSLRAIIIAAGAIISVICIVFGLYEKQPVSTISGAFVVAITFILTFLMPNDSKIPYGSLEYNGHHYYIYSDSTTEWKDAVSKCNERGGYLAVINDANENEVLFDYMVKMGFDMAYFGLYKTESGKWKYPYNNKDTSDFEEWGYNSIGEKEPNNKDGGNHVGLDSHMSNGHWNDAYFGREVFTPEGGEYKDKAAYICEWDY